MEEGDAFIALHSLPHTATPNMSDDPRVNVYWRVRRWRSEKLKPDQYRRHAFTVSRQGHR